MYSRQAFAASFAVSVAVAWGSPQSAQHLPGEPDSPVEQLAFLKIRPGYSDCLDAAGSSMPLMIRCNQDEYRYQDSRLNVAYKELAAILPYADRGALKEDERDWVILKAKACEIPTDAGQGDILDAVTCSMTFTARRATYLEGRLSK